MDWLVGLLLLLVGGIIGFFVSTYFNKESQSSSDKVASEQTIQELMNQQAVMHAQETKQIAEKLIAQSTLLKQQVEDYEQQLIGQQTRTEEGSLSYFGEQTAAYLRNKSSKAVREKPTADVQPLDFSSKSSGLFSGNEDVSAKETK